MMRGARDHTSWAGTPSVVAMSSTGTRATSIPTTGRSSACRRVDAASPVAVTQGVVEDDDLRPHAQQRGGELPLTRDGA